MSLQVSAELRAKDPAFAAACDAIALWETCVNIQKAALDLKDHRIAQLEAELATLRAQLSAKAAA